MQRDSGPGTWIRRYRPRPDAAVRLVCFPHAGGSAVVFHQWASAFPADVEVLAVQYPGRQDRIAEPRVENLAELAKGVLPALRDAVGDSPYALFGHSMGATLAFEVARRLEADGTGPGILVASARRAPSRQRDQLVHLLDDAQLAAHIAELSPANSRLMEDARARAMIVPTVRSDLRAIETYRCPPGLALRTPILTVIGDSDPWTTLDEAQAWARHTRGGFELRLLPGGHFYLDDHQDEVRELVRARLGHRVA
ncbi:thioesterase II family protein [Streptomyces sp. NPDC005017]|uniref:thioesterase II family protein n=1 Tax=Streptomyces sp. NPDC005017 TaxID=3364706 RepID=UPI0036C9F96B